MQVIGVCSPVVKIIGLFNILLGMVGLVLALIFSQPYYVAAGHASMYALGQIALYLGPALMLAGELMLVWSVRKEISMKRQLDLVSVSHQVPIGYSFDELRNRMKECGRVEGRPLKN